MIANRTEYEGFEGAGDAERRLLKQEELILDVTEMLCRVMIENEISRSELAERLGKSRAYVTQLLSGGRNLTLRTLSDLADALKCRSRFSLDQRVSAKCVIHHGPWESSRFQIVPEIAESEVRRDSASGGVA